MSGIFVCSNMCLNVLKFFGDKTQFEKIMIYNLAYYAMYYRYKRMKTDNGEFTIDINRMMPKFKCL